MALFALFLYWWICWNNSNFLHSSKRWLAFAEFSRRFQVNLGHFYPAYNARARIFFRKREILKQSLQFTELFSISVHWVGFHSPARSCLHDASPTHLTNFPCPMEQVNHSVCKTDATGALPVGTSSFHSIQAEIALRSVGSGQKAGASPAGGSSFIAANANGERDGS